MTTPASQTLASKPIRRILSGDRYLTFLACVLLGYAVMGKGFAYVGVPPLYIGEIAFVAGMAVLVRSGAIVASVASLPGVLLALTMGLVALRTAPYVGAYGVDALRDSVIILYGGFAFIVIGLLLDDPRRIDAVLRYYRIFLNWFPAIPAGFWLTKYWTEWVPKVFGPGIPIVDIQASAVGTHLGGAAVFVLLGFRKASAFWLVTWFITLAMMGATNRGATLAALVPVIFTLIVLGRVRLIVTSLVALVSIFSVLLVIESGLTQYQEVKDSADREVSAHQIFENAKSIVGQSGQQTEGTKQWRLNWWNVIINDTFNGPNFWTGRGFGLNLADADGFGGVNEGSTPLRSPHNAHMTVLARAGVPGVALWWVTLLCWGALVLKTMVVAQARGHREWAFLFLWPLCYCTSILINATFDVTLEGPMQGIWFWCLFGFGLGSVMVYRAGVSRPIDKAMQ